MVNKTYRLLTKIGEGSFGKIFSAQHKDTGQKVAIKLVKAADAAMYENELAMYAKLQHISSLCISSLCISSLFAAGMEGPYYYLVMDLYEQNLEQLRASFGCMPLKVVLHLGVQMLAIVESLHQKGVLHRDIKPANFMIKTNAQNISELFIIDFGLAGCFKDENQKHIQMKTGERLMGTLRYMSVNMHQQITPSRRDDLESLGYILIYLYKGKLPWQVSQAQAQQAQAQAQQAQAQAQAQQAQAQAQQAQMQDDGEMALSIKQSFGWAYANSIVGEFILFIQYCRNLQFAEDPNYDYLRTLLTNLNKIST
jgi:serine/threonine protein kinase